MELKMSTPDLSSLTIEYLEAFIALEGAEAAFELLPVFQNKLAAMEALDGAEDAEERLKASIGENLTIFQYILGIHRLTSRILDSQASSQSSMEEAEWRQQSKP